MYWARLVRDASTIFDNTMTFRDTVIVNPLFMPIVFRGDYYRELDILQLRFVEGEDSLMTIYRADSKFQRFTGKNNHSGMKPQCTDEMLTFAVPDLPNGNPSHNFIKKMFEDMNQVEADANFEDVDAPARFIRSGDTGYRPSQGAVNSPRTTFPEDWYKGGSSNLNLFTKNNLKYRAIRKIRYKKRTTGIQSQRIYGTEGYLKEL